MFAAATALATAELVAGLLIGRFFDWGRAEALIFLAFRPWLLLVLALVVRGFNWRGRSLGYFLFLILAGSAETLLLLGLGASNPWPELVRGLAASAVLCLLFDLAFQGVRRLSGKWWAAAGAALVLALLLLTPIGPRAYERIILSPRPAPAADRPDLMLMSGLPLFWGEGGAFDSESRPERSYLALESEFQIRPLDTLDPASLGQGRLLLLAQPLRLDPNELVSLDQWVRAGGRALILTDPLLTWPSKLPLGDIRRPPPVGLLGPLLTHWGLTLKAGPSTGPTRLHLKTMNGDRLLALDRPGRLSLRSDACTLFMQEHLARCRIGEGEAMILADADLLRDSLWTGPGLDGDRRHARIADNPLVVADWTDELAGSRRERIEGPVEWLAEGAGRPGALVLAMLPLIAGVAGWLTLRRKGQR